ncbi:glycosyltransferase [Arenimonas sp.]|uniref:glycosyltransferase n=1 Tax=Arenimonas sp. TaxID=1872635 RepID=UPI0039E32ED7
MSDATHGGRRLSASGMAYRLNRWFGLFRRGLASLRTRGVRATWSAIRERYRSRPAPAPLRLYPEPVSARELSFPFLARPRASVIVPAYGQLDYSLHCLKALAKCGDAAGFEVILVDDASPDGSADVLAEVAGLRLHRNERNLGFIGACNAGARIARGDYLVFLNNDTAVQPGWLDALLSTFQAFPDTGLAGSKLVYPDGRLQEAGGLVFGDGSAWNVGRFEDPAHPTFNFLREADYCSGAAIALRRELFERLEGFDPHFAPAYYEDTDLAMRVRRAGLKVRYQPASVVVHYEGATAGTDTAQGVKAHQITNQSRFRQRWQHELATQHAPAAWRGQTDASVHRGRRRVLVIDACTPTPDRDSGSVRMLALLRLLCEEGCSVSFFAENLAHDGGYTLALQQLGVEAWWHPWIGDVPAWLREHGPRFDLIVVSRHYVLSPLLRLLREHAPQAQLVFDTVDLHFLREEREAAQTGDQAAAQAAQRSRESELALTQAADATWVVSPHEQALLRELVPGAKVEIVSNIHRSDERTPDFASRRDLVFVGGYRHPPNVDAALWFVDEILPRIREQVPDLRVHLVGGDAPARIVALGERTGVVFHGHVPMLDALIDGMRLSVAPLRYGAGVKGKINHSLSRGLPVVATPCAVEGMRLHDGENVLVADEAAAFADAVVRLYTDDSLWQRLRVGGLENTQRHFSPEAARQTLQGLLAALTPRN